MNTKLHIKETFCPVSRKQKITYCVSCFVSAVGLPTFATHGEYLSHKIILHGKSS